MGRATSAFRLTITACVLPQQRKTRFLSPNLPITTRCSTNCWEDIWTKAGGRCFKNLTRAQPQDRHQQPRAFSTDNIGMNYDYPEATYERRKEILKEHEDYQKGLMWALAYDPRVPEDVRAEMSQWASQKTNLPTMATGHTRSMCAKRGGW
ncbi:MAG: FAD-dependent oxidoreductase [Bacteroidia bacterium]